MLDDLLTDLIVDSILEGRRSAGNSPAGFSLGERYIKSWTSLKNRKLLITEDDVKEVMRAGKDVEVTDNTIITPMAQDLIKEKSLKIVRKG